MISIDYLNPPLFFFDMEIIGIYLGKLEAFLALRYKRLTQSISHPDVGVRI
jgi:hypothetical protein